MQRRGVTTRVCKRQSGSIAQGHRRIRVEDGVNCRVLQVSAGPSFGRNLERGGGKHRLRGPALTRLAMCTGISIKNELEHLGRYHRRCIRQQHSWRACWQATVTQCRPLLCHKTKCGQAPRNSSSIASGESHSCSLLSCRDMRTSVEAKVVVFTYLSNHSSQDSASPCNP